MSGIGKSSNHPADQSSAGQSRRQTRSLTRRAAQAEQEHGYSSEDEKLEEEEAEESVAKTDPPRRSRKRRQREEEEEEEVGSGGKEAWEEEEETETEETENVVSRKRQKKECPVKPKGGAYMYFLAAFREQKKEELKDMKFVEVGKIAGQAWQELPPEEKEIYQKMSEEDRARYAQETRTTFKPGRRTRVRAKKAAPKPGQPSRPKGAFFYYLDEFKEEYRKKHPKEKPVASTLSKLAGEKWKSMNKDAKKPYLDRAEQDKLAFQAWKEQEEAEHEEQRAALEAEVRAIATHTEAPPTAPPSPVAELASKAPAVARIDLEATVVRALRAAGITDETVIRQAVAAALGAQQAPHLEAAAVEQQLTQVQPPVEAPVASAPPALAAPPAAVAAPLPQPPPLAPLPPLPPIRVPRPTVASSTTAIESPTGIGRLLPAPPLNIDLQRQQSFAERIQAQIDRELESLRRIMVLPTPQQGPLLQPPAPDTGTAVAPALLGPAAAPAPAGAGQPPQPESPMASALVSPSGVQQLAAAMGLPPAVQQQPPLPGVPAVAPGPSISVTEGIQPPQTDSQQHVRTLKQIHEALLQLSGIYAPSGIGSGTTEVQPAVQPQGGFHLVTPEFLPVSATHPQPQPQLPLAPAEPTLIELAPPAAVITQAPLGTAQQAVLLHFPQTQQLPQFVQLGSVPLAAAAAAAGVQPRPPSAGGLVAAPGPPTLQPALPAYFYQPQQEAAPAAAPAQSGFQPVYFPPPNLAAMGLQQPTTAPQQEQLPGQQQPLFQHPGSRFGGSPAADAEVDRPPAQPETSHSGS